MPRESSRGNYTGISMPKELIDEVEKTIRSHPELQYRSRAEFVKSAIREKLEKETLSPIANLNIIINEMEVRRKKLEQGIPILTKKNDPLAQRIISLEHQLKKSEDIFKEAQQEATILDKTVNIKDKTKDAFTIFTVLAETLKDIEEKLDQLTIKIEKKK